jgi:hypothetical protein
MICAKVLVNGKWLAVAQQLLKVEIDKDMAVQESTSVELGYGTITA